MTPKPLRHPYPTLRRLPEKQLTICIAANSEHGKYLVCATDTMVSNQLTTTDPLTVKTHFVSDWTVLLSGTLSEADLLVEAITDEILAQVDNEPQTIRKCLEKVHREQMASWGGRWLSPYGLTMEGFLASGNTLPESVQSELSRQIAFGAEQYDPEIIVCGWGAKTTKRANEENVNLYPHIFSIDYHGVHLHKTTGLHAIGSGSPAALSTLYFHNYGPRVPLAEAIYFVASAKFMAERTLGVGETTSMVVMLRTGGYFGVMSPEISAIRKEWEDKGAPKLPPTAIETVRKMLDKRFRDKPNPFKLGEARP